MAFQEERRFLFRSQALPEDTFGVVSFSGSEGISRLYEFHITLVSDLIDIDIKQVLKQPATFSILHDDKEIQFHGIPAYFEQLHEVDKFAYYKTALVPRLWLSNLNHENQLFLDKSVPEIIEEILKQAGLSSKDYEFKLTGNYRKWEYICQYRETDYNFISRWMEREGIYFYFDQTEQGEKLIITDTSSVHQDIPHDTEIYYSPPSALVPTEEEGIKSFVCRQQRLPKKVILKDYNYRKPSLEIRGEAVVDPDSIGEVYLYGEHFKTPEEGDALAKIRAQELICRERLFFGESTCPSLRPGYLFKLEDHYRDDFNQKYLVVEIEHRGSQSALFLAGLEQELSEEEEQLSYSNSFVAIPADVQFRPERKTEKPRFYGTMNAKVDAAGDGKYAEIDEWGRYKVRLPFDLKNPGDGKASRWVRMAQPYAGAGYGMHFPLHKGTEVLLTFVDGDPDRPIIASAVPNPETQTPVTDKNPTKAGFTTGGGNVFMMEDSDGSQRISMVSGDGKFTFRMGSGSDPNATVIGQTGTISIHENLGTGLLDACRASIGVGASMWTPFRSVLAGAITAAKTAVNDPVFQQSIDSTWKLIDSLIKFLLTRSKIEIAKFVLDAPASIAPIVSLSASTEQASLTLDAIKTDASIALSAQNECIISANKKLWLHGNKGSYLSGEDVIIGSDKNIIIWIPTKCSVMMEPGKIEHAALKHISFDTEKIISKADQIISNANKEIKMESDDRSLFQSRNKTDIQLENKSSQINLEKDKLKLKANKKIGLSTRNCSLSLNNNDIVLKGHQKVEQNVKGSFVKTTTKITLNSKSQISIKAKANIDVKGAMIKLG